MKFDKLVEQLLEGTSPLRTMYHNTNFSNIVLMLRSNYFKCEYNANDIKYRFTKLFEKYPYYMSTARVPNNRYARKQSVFSSVVSLELDATKLSDHGYPIRPINFFVMRNAREAEDRVLSKKDKIDNFNQYIKAFHIYIHPTDIKNIMNNNGLADMDKAYFNSTIRSILATNKPSYVYKTRDEFHSMNKAKREPLSEKHFIS